MVLAEHELMFFPKSSHLDINNVPFSGEDGWLPTVRWFTFWTASNITVWSSINDKTCSLTSVLRTFFNVFFNASVVPFTQRLSLGENLYSILLTLNLFNRSQSIPLMIYLSFFEVAADCLPWSLKILFDQPLTLVNRRNTCNKESVKKFWPT